MDQKHEFNAYLYVQTASRRRRIARGSGHRQLNVTAMLGTLVQNSRSLSLTLFLPYSLCRRRRLGGGASRAGRATASWT